MCLLLESKPKTTGPAELRGPTGASLLTPLFPSRFSGLPLFVSLPAISHWPSPAPNLRKALQILWDPQGAALPPSPPYSYG